MGLTRCARFPDKLRFRDNAKGKKEAARYIQKLQGRAKFDGQPAPNTYYTCPDCGWLHLTRREKATKAGKRKRVAA